MNGFKGWRKSAAASGVGASAPTTTARSSLGSVDPGLQPGARSAPEEELFGVFSQSAKSGTDGRYGTARRVCGGGGGRTATSGGANEREAGDGI